MKAASKPMVHRMVASSARTLERSAFVASGFGCSAKVHLRGEIVMTRSGRSANRVHNGFRHRFIGVSFPQCLDGGVSVERSRRSCRARSRCGRLAADEPPRTAPSVREGRQRHGEPRRSSSRPRCASPPALQPTACLLRLPSTAGLPKSVQFDRGISALGPISNPTAATILQQQRRATVILPILSRALPFAPRRRSRRGPGRPKRELLEQVRQGPIAIG